MNDHRKYTTGLGFLLLLLSAQLQACGWPGMWADAILQSDELYELHLLELQGCTFSYDAETEAEPVLAALAHSIELGAPQDLVRDVVIAYQCLPSVSDQPDHGKVATFLEVETLGALCAAVSPS